jgi:hypothetical protein
LALRDFGERLVSEPEYAYAEEPAEQGWVGGGEEWAGEEPGGLDPFADPEEFE